jgi:pimeloyl-ACP methyl ester carboxylesterase
LLRQLARAAVRRAGTPPIGTPDGIASLEPIALHGDLQWVLMRGKDRRNPVLLYVHGGPGSAEMALAHRSMARLEAHFVCVNWDQRGAGKSFVSGADPRTLTIQQFVDDTVALIEVLRARFHQDRVFLLGHSWGTVLTMKVAAARPDLVHALIALSQVVDMRRGEELSYAFVLRRAHAAGDAKAVRALERIGAPPYADGDVFIQRRWLSAYHGDLYAMDMLDLLSIALDAPEYDLGDVVRLLRGAKRTSAVVWGELAQVSFLRAPPTLSVPVTFFVGRHDRTTPPELTVALHDAMEAPEKRMVWFEGSAHMANVEEPEAFQREVVAVARRHAASRG